MNSPVRHETKFYACYSQYWMIGTLDCEDEVPEPKSVTSERRIDVTRKGRVAKVETYHQHGDVPLVFEFHEHEPPPKPGEWHEVVENSMRLATDLEGGLSEGLTIGDRRGMPVVYGIRRVGV
ncbi:hypothetical protein [Streptomyces chattanoogensis]|uniref:hypothetical protein n=1 Tax=Streptomyces chattanoogensis TaxID=66876 RepID=UPI00369344B5